jgi:hypothetical protein
MRFNLRFLAPWVWPLLFVLCLNAFAEIIIAIQFRFQSLISIGEIKDISTSLNAFSVMIGAILAMQFLPTGRSGIRTPSDVLMPEREFLLVHPVSRRTAYFSRMLLFFIIVLLPSLLEVSAALVKPDLEMSLDRSRKQNTEAADIEKLYQDQFPNSSIIQIPKANHDILVIPFGALLIALWVFCLTICIALILQMAILLMLPIPIQWGILTGICMVLLFTSQTKTENAFFFFAHHWPLISLLALGTFVFIQWLALKQIQNLEII